MPLSAALDATLAALAARDDDDPAWRSELRAALGQVRDEVRHEVGRNSTVEFGMGYGAVAQVPWVVVLRPGQSPREGHYPVFLFARDGSAAFLSLNQGSELRGLSAVRTTTERLRGAIGELPAGMQPAINLQATTNGPRKYEAGNVAAFEYRRGSLPADEQLSRDLARMRALSEGLAPAENEPEPETGSAWIFQSSPDQYDLSGALDTLDEFGWLVNQYSKQIRAGDRVYLWETGQDAGVVAVGEITTDPEVMPESAEEQEFWQTPATFSGPRLRVRIVISDVLEPRLSRRDIARDPVLAALPNLRFANATNFPVTREQEAQLRRLILEARGPRGHRMVLKIAPGENGSLWADCLANGYIRVGWDELGDLRAYESQSDLRDAFRREYPANSIASASRLWLLRQLRPGDIVIANQGMGRILGVGTVTDAVDWLESLESFRTIVRVDWDASLARDVSPPIRGWRPTIQTVEESVLCSLLPELCGPEPPDIAAPTFEWLANETLWEADRLNELVDAIRGPSPQLILAGPPGTGKTWVAERVARYVTADRPGARRLVQFHPSYTYEQFIEGLRPVAEKGAIEFRRVDGIVIDTVKRMTDPDALTVIVIDEMNRANLAKVFGELMYLFEYRDAPIDLQYSTGFRLPRGLRFIGSMNTADRSIRSIDIALRRRFDIFECPPDRGILERYYATRENLVPDLFDGFDALNAALTEQLDRHHTIGHTFFMANPMTPDQLAAVWDRKIGPLVDEYFFDQPDLAASYRAARFWPSLE